MAASASCKRFDGAIGRAIGDRDPDARRHRDLGARQGERLEERLCGAIGELDGLRFAGEVFAQHDELVAAEAGDGVLTTNGRVQAPAHRDQQLVAGLVPEAVVHQLEPVEVDEQHRDHRVVVGVAEAFERVLEPVLGQRAVGQAGEGVVQREPTQLLGAGIPVDGEGGEVARPFEHTQLTGLGVAHGVEEEAEQPEELAPVG